MLMNVGFVEAMADFNWTCAIFHDVDLLPEDDRNLYTCPQQPRHMSVAVDKFSYKLPYPDIFGGVTALLQDHFRRINGYSNKFWGWGSEDDDVRRRVLFHNLTVTRYEEDVARYKMIVHKQEEPNPARKSVFSEGPERFVLLSPSLLHLFFCRYSWDGLTDLVYNRLSKTLLQDFTMLNVSLVTTIP